MKSKITKPCATCSARALAGSSSCLMCWKLWWDGVCAEATRRALEVKAQREAEGLT